MKFSKDINDYPLCIIDIELPTGLIAYASAEDIVFEGREGCTFNLLSITKKDAAELARKYPETSWNNPIQFDFSEDEKKIICAHTINGRVVSVTEISLLKS